MIALLTGKPLIVNDYLVIQTNSGVGYKVFAGAKILQKANLNELTLFVYSYIKEDRFELYGFQSEGELKLFEMLINVSGCGPKTALGVAEAGSQAIVTAVQEAQVSFFTAFPRVGKSLAQKLIIELKNKVGGLKDLDLTPKSQNYADALETLVALGFVEGHIEAVLQDFDLEQMETGEAVKQALKKLSKR